MNVKRKIFSLTVLILLTVCLSSCDISLPDFFSKPNRNDDTSPSQTESSQESEIDSVTETDTDPAQESESGFVTETDTEKIEQETQDNSRYALSLSNPNPELGILSGQGTFLSKESVTVTAEPSLLGYAFDGWYANGVRMSSEPSYTFSMPARHLTLEARWKTAPELSGLSFRSTKTTCTITGVSDKSLSTITLPDFVTALEAGAFQDCTALQSLRLPASITAIPENALRGCTSLTELRCDGTITEIGANAFTDCNSAAFTEYQNGLYFAGDSAYTWLVRPVSTLISDCVIHEQAQFILDRAFRNCASLKEITIPEGIKAIPAHAFDGCSSLTTVSFPQSLSMIDMGAFDNCPALANIRFAGTTDQWDALHIETGNNRLDALAIHCKNGDATYEIRGYGRAHLYGNEAYVYDLLEQAVFLEELPESISLDSNRHVSPAQCKTAFEIFLLDYPECFWLKQGFSYLPTKPGGTIVAEVHPMYLMTGNELAHAKLELQAVVDEILKDMPSEGYFEQTHYLHDAVVNRVSYIPNDNWDQTSYSALVNGEAVCAGYAAAYQLLLQSAGYKVWSVNGYSRNQAHRWNIVWLDHATCVYTDVTWDDYQDEQVLHGYFNRSLEEFSKTHEVTNPVPLPECNHEGQGYFDHPSRQYQVIAPTDSFEKLSPLLQKNDDGTYSARLYYTGENFMNWLIEHKEAVATYCGFTRLSVNMETQSENHQSGEILLTLIGS